MNPKVKRIILWVLALTLMAGLVYATADLLGQTNKKAADAGSNATDMEMATLDTIKKPAKSDNINWAEITPVDRKLKSIDAKYKVAVDKAGAEKAAGTVSEATRSEGMSLAQQYHDTALQLAAVYEKNNMITRAKTVRQLAKTRLANADMSFNEVDSARIDAYKAEQAKLGEARKAYFAENDLSAADKAELKRNVLPRVQQTSTNLLELVDTVASLVLQVKNQVGGGVSAASIGGCAKSAVSSAASGGGVTSLLGPLQALLSLAQGMSGDAQSLASDLSSL